MPRAGAGRWLTAADDSATVAVPKYSDSTSANNIEEYNDAQLPARHPDHLG